MFWIRQTSSKAPLVYLISKLRTIKVLGAVDGKVRSFHLMRDP